MGQSTGLLSIDEEKKGVSAHNNHVVAPHRRVPFHAERENNRNDDFIFAQMWKGPRDGSKAVYYAHPRTKL